MLEMDCKMSPVIETKNLTKIFRLYHSPIERLSSFIPFSNNKCEEHTALENINFKVEKGEFVSIIGRNGSGKSTLLKIICGVLQTSSGSYETKGKIVSLLELGTGFNPELTGRENIINSARVMAFSVKEIKNKIKTIEEFADIEEYFDMPVRTYSSGMYVRLAMSLFLHLEPEVFIIDEALSVGDIFFVQKCFSKIEEMRKNGVSFLFVSHDINLVQTISDKVLLLNKGKALYFGDGNEACKIYFDIDKLIKPNESLSEQQEVEDHHDYNELKNKKQLFHKEGGRINSLIIVNEFNDQTLQVEMTKVLEFQIAYQAFSSIKNPAISIVMKNRKNIVVTTIIYKLEHEKSIIAVKIPFFVEAGEYTFDLIIGDMSINSGIFICEYKDLGPISVLFDYQNERAPFLGQFGLNTNSRNY